MLGRKTKTRPPLTYEAVPSSARLDAAYKNAFNFSRDVSDLYAHTSISGLRKRSRTQPADQHGMLMGDINIVANKGTNFQEKVGGPRAAIAFTQRAQLASTRNDNHIGVFCTFTTTGFLTQSGTSTTINVAATTCKQGDLTINYNSGSVDPGSYGKFWVYVDDPFFIGGAVIYRATAVVADLTSAMGRESFGSLTTAGGGGGSGGGGGTGCVLDGTIIEALGDEPMILEQYEESRWYTIVTEHFSLTGTYDHPVCEEHSGFVPMSNISVGDYVVTKRGSEKVVNCYTRLMPETKIKVTMAHGHLFWGNGILCHNIKPT